MLKLQKKSAVYSSLFSLGNRYIQLILNIAALAILGRLIEPEHFGIVAIVLAAQMIFAPLLDMGLSTAYVKLEIVGPAAQNAFFTLSAILGFINCLYLILISPVLAYIYGNNSFTVLAQ